MSKITPEEYRNLCENFETFDILTAIDQFDSARGYIADQSLNTPPELRINLLKLHDLAMNVISYGNNDKEQIKELFELADDIEWDIDNAISSLKKVRKVVRNLTALCPNSIYTDDILSDEDE
jgi:hypothetical protein